MIPVDPGAAIHIQQEWRKSKTMRTWSHSGHVWSVSRLRNASWMSGWMLSLKAEDMPQEWTWSWTWKREIIIYRIHFWDIDILWIWRKRLLTVVSFFRIKNDIQRLCDLHAAFYIILYWRNEKNDNICFKITFYNLFLVSCFVLSESIYLWLRRASRNEFVCQESVC